MKIYRFFAIAVLSTLFLAASPQKMNAQISVQIGAPPVCPYGYYEYAPYNCAPYGYYGPEWFSNGVFVGAGPWFHGNPHFWGHVDNRYDPRYGYRGEYPHRGEHYDVHHHPGQYEHFRGNEMRDGHGHAKHEEHEREEHERH